MKITGLRRLAGFASLLLLSLLLVAVFVQAAPAMHDFGSGAGGGVTVASAGTAQAGTLGRGGVSLPAGVAAARAPAPTSGTSSSTPWIAAGIIAAAFVAAIAVWATSRRRSVRPSAEYCSLHPDDALCGAA